MQRLLIEVGRAHKLLDEAEHEVDATIARTKIQSVRQAYGWALASFRRIDPSAEERVTFLVETEMLRRRLGD